MIPQFTGQPIMIDLEALRLDGNLPANAGRIDLSGMMGPRDDIDIGAAGMEQRMSEMGEFSILSVWARRKPASEG